MTRANQPANVAVIATDVAPPERHTAYPEPFASRVIGRVRRRLGDVFGLKNFGVNLTRMVPGGISSLRHGHSRQEEFIYVLEGTPMLVTDFGETPLGPGHCAGFPVGGGSHQLVNRSRSDVWFLEVGDRTVGDRITYPEDDLQAEFGPDGRWVFVRKNGVPLLRLRWRSISCR
ncbi:MAG: cupin domain-containing protein [Steroidobacteraceae bacterium]